MKFGNLFLCKIFLLCTIRGRKLRENAVGMLEIFNERRPKSSAFLLLLLHCFYHI
jgi:hypothetical protein